MIKMKIPSLRLRKRVLFLPFGKAKGSMALEGSLALPLFLFFMMTVLLGLEAVRFQSNVLEALHQSGNKAAFEGYLTKYAGKERAGAKGQIREYLDGQAYPYLCVAGGAEGVQVEEKALRYIAKTADGSMRDALSLLDQCIAFHLGHELTYDKVLDVLGAVDTEVFSRLLRGILDRNVLGCVQLLEEIVMQGRELTQFVTDFTWYLRNLLLALSSEDIEDVIDVSTENMARLKEEAKMTDMNSVMRYIRIFSELSGNIRYASQKRILIEVALIKLCRPSMEKDSDSLLARVRSLENKIENGLITVAPQKMGENSSADNLYIGGNKEEARRVNKELPKAVPEDVRRAVESWASIVMNIEQPMKTYLKDARLSLGGNNKLMVVVKDGLASDYLIKNPENKEHLQRIVSEAIQKEIEIDIQSLAEDKAFEDSYIDLSEVIHMDIEIED